MNTASSRALKNVHTRRGVTRHATRLALATSVAIGGVAVAGPSADASKPASVKLRHGELLVTGTKRDESVTVRLGRVSDQLLVVDVGDDGWPEGLFPRKWVDRITISTQGGNDRVWIDDAYGGFTDTKVTSIDTGDGDDVVVGGAGAETIAGGSGDDVVEGGGGDDSVVMGAGDDSFQWQPGDGNDHVGGEDGRDVLDVVGDDESEFFNLGPNGVGGVIFTRHIDGVSLQLDRVEHLNLTTAGGSDTVFVEDLSTLAGTGVEAMHVDTGIDGLNDGIFLTGSAGDDDVVIAGSNGSMTVTGLAMTLDAIGEADTALFVNTFDGNDTVDSTALAPSPAYYVVDSGDGDDTLVGGAADEYWSSEAGADTISAGGGRDEVFGGAGDDHLQGEDGDDYLDGGDGYDVLIGGAGEDRFANGEDISDE